MKKRNIIIIVIVAAVLIITVGVFAFLNAGNIKEKKMLEEEAVILVKSACEELGKINMEIFESIGQKDFSANLDTSDSEAEEHTYTGVLLNDALKKIGIDIGKYSTLVAKAIDGYTVVFEASEVNAEDNIYIATKQDGKDIGTKSSGGRGPYQIIVRKDTFSQRWCKFLVELELK